MTRQYVSVLSPQRVLTVLQPRRVHAANVRDGRDATA